MKYRETDRIFKNTVILIFGTSWQLYLKSVRKTNIKHYATVTFEVEEADDILLYLLDCIAVKFTPALWTADS